eukprot:755579-Hanusia_phi.AAC.6
MSSGKVDMRELLGCCVYACERAGEIIRDVERRREQGKLAGTMLKDASDSRSYLTEADTSAQRAILEILRGSFPQISIIAEEEEEEDKLQEAEGRPYQLPPVELGDVPDQLKSVAAEDICVFVDPVDGTKEFVEGRLEAVQTLVGISVNGRPTGGAIGIPFLSGKEEVHVVYGLVGAGLKNVPAPSSDRRDEAGIVLAASPSGKEQAVLDARELLAAGKLITPGGVGNKVRGGGGGEGRTDVCRDDLESRSFPSCEEMRTVR